MIRRWLPALSLSVGFGLLVAGCGSSGSGALVVPLATAAGTLSPRGPAIADVPVERVVDGDTIKVLLNGRSTTVRMIGIDTPETVKEGTPVQCFGPEASDLAKAALEGTRVTLEADPAQGPTDRYGRMLAYVWRQLPDGTVSMFNLESVANGFARERQYGPNPNAWRTELRAAQREAQGRDLGLWGAC